MSGLRSQRGQELVEFALVAPILLLILVGAFDLMRIVQVGSTVADAARQGARQAVADAVSGDQPFGTPNGLPCSGTAFTGNVTGTGCLTNAAIKSTVDLVLGPTVTGSSLYTSTPSACPVPSVVTTASVCVYPDQATRGAEWTSLAQQGGFLVTVTVVMRYSPLTPVVARIFPAVFSISSTTSTVAEF